MEALLCFFSQKIPLYTQLHAISFKGISHTVDTSRLDKWEQQHVAHVSAASLAWTWRGTGDPELDA